MPIDDVDGPTSTTRRPGLDSLFQPPLSCKYFYLKTVADINLIGAAVILRSITVSHFKNFLEPQVVEIEDDVTCLVGKNESGKTTILKALHRLNPASGDGQQFDITTEYPRWRLARDRRTTDLEEVVPILAVFELDASDRDQLSESAGVTLPTETECVFERNYANELLVSVRAPLHAVIQAAAQLRVVTLQPGLLRFRGGYALRYLAVNGMGV